ncbi:MFS general substrate transporter [Aspergillus ellipticus CBS 707.79]|uniref:MFS general substrate transporter n=1 Tax=Aspergillus ellipticus CBS 707.79 TaxID=1448320 RepID=A0A319E045_9EURO|nr:MFS general substrate transporter [Aspergillus ellipticus CBS 707.79]
MWLRSEALGLIEESDSNIIMFKKKREEGMFHIGGLSPTREILMLFTICSAQGMVQASLAQGFLPGIMIGEAFGAESTDIAWYPAAYALTSGAFMLAFGRVGDIVGHKRLFVAAWGWFSVWALLAGISVYSGSQVFFDICRACQGIAAAALVPSALAILGTVYKPGPRKNLAFSLYASGAPIGFTLGAVFSAMLAQLATWPWVFYINAIACLMYEGLAYLFVPNIGRKPSSTREPFDYLGTSTIISGLVLFNFAWNRAPETGWASAQCITTLIIGLLLIAAFFPLEKRTAHAIVPVAKIDRDAAWILLVEGLGWSSFGILCYYAINFVIRLRGDTMLSAAAQLSPVPPAGIAASILTSNLLTRGVKPPVILAFSLIWFCVGNIILATMPVHQTYWRNVFWAYLLSPFGMDMSFPAGTIMLSNLVPVEGQGIAASLIATVVYYSQSLGLGIAGVVEVNVANGSVLEGYRGALYLGVGLSGFGFIVGVGYAMRCMRQNKTNPGSNESAEDPQPTPPLAASSEQP